MIDHWEDVRKAHEEDDLAFGTIESWIAYVSVPSHSLSRAVPADRLFTQNLLGGVSAGQHISEVTNASRTLLLNIRTLQWDPALLRFFGIRESVLPRLVSTSEVYGKIPYGPLKGVPLGGLVGDQQGALIGNKCLAQGQAKCTYGTGAFLLFCTGTDIVYSTHGLLSTVRQRLEIVSDTNNSHFRSRIKQVQIASLSTLWKEPVRALLLSSPNRTHSDLPRSCRCRQRHQMAARLDGTDPVSQRDQHARGLRALSVRGLLRHGVLGLARAVLGPRRDGAADRANVVHDPGAHSACDARGERVPDARSDQEHDARRTFGARAPQGGRRDDERGPRDGGTCGRWRVRGHPARNA